jgi:hypothetical protein
MALLNDNAIGQTYYDDELTEWANDFVVALEARDAELNEEWKNDLLQATKDLVDAMNALEVVALTNKLDTIQIQLNQIEADQYWDAASNFLGTAKVLYQKIEHPLVAFNLALSLVVNSGQFDEADIKAIIQPAFGQRAKLDAIEKTANEILAENARQTERKLP